MIDSFCLLANVQNLFVYKVVEFSLVDPVSCAILFSVAVVSVTSIFDSQGFVTPLAFDRDEGRSAVAALEQSRVSVTGISCARPDVTAFLLCDQLLYQFELFF